MLESWELKSASAARTQPAGRGFRSWAAPGLGKAQGQGRRRL